jgi:hypothetical protein
VGEVELTGSGTTSGTYTLNGIVVPNACVLQIDLSGVELKAEAQLSLSFTIEHDGTASGTGAPFNSATTPVTSINFDYVLQQDFASPFDLAQDPNFIRRIGQLILKSVGTNTSTTLNKLVDSGANFTGDGVEVGDFVTNNTTNQQAAVIAVAATELTLDGDIFTSSPQDYSIYDASSIRDVSQSCNGITLTDFLNCASTSTLGTYSKVSSGIGSLPQPVAIISVPTSNIIALQIPAMKYQDGASNAFEYYGISNLKVTYRELGNPKSLHSNRGYEVGIVYMDEFNRSSTALVSENNTEYVPCGNADLTNRIKVTIPVQQLAPSWATRYKFCIKADKDTYETIYTNLFFTDVVSGTKWFILEGENSRKVEAGDELIVKRDTSGPLNRCETATVLAKEAKQADFISPKPVDSQGNEVAVPAGVYMKMLANDFIAILDDDDIISPGTKYVEENNFSDFPTLVYDNLGGFTIPAGSRIKAEMTWTREGSALFDVPGNDCSLTVEFISPAEYADIVDWFDGANIQDAFTSAFLSIPLNDFTQTIARQPNTSSTASNYGLTNSLINVQYVWYRNAGDIRFVTRGLQSYGNTKNRRSKISVNWEIIRAENTIVFETEPSDALPDVWYESSESYAIDQSTGYHEGSDGVYQTSTTPTVQIVTGKQ